MWIIPSERPSFQHTASARIGSSAPALADQAPNLPNLARRLLSFPSWRFADHASNALCRAVVLAGASGQARAADNIAGAQVHEGPPLDFHLHARHQPPALPVAGAMHSLTLRASCFTVYGFGKNPAIASPAKRVSTSISPNPLQTRTATSGRIPRIRANVSQSIHSRHRDIEQHQSDVTGSLLENAHPFLTILRQQHAIPVWFECRSDKFSDQFLVVDNENGPGTAQIPGNRIIRNLRRRLLGGRKQHPEGASPARNAVDLYHTFVLPHDAQNGCESESTTRKLRCEERVEDLAYRLFIHSRTVIEHLNKNVLAARHLFAQNTVLQRLVGHGLAAGSHLYDSLARRQPPQRR